MRTLEKNKTFQEMEKILKVFHQGMLQDFFTFLGILGKENITLRDIKRYIKQVKEETRINALVEIEREKKSLELLKEQKEWKRLVQHCPNCNLPLMLNRIQEAKGKSNTYGYRAVWRCPGENCFFEEYSKEYPEAIYDKLMGR